MADNPLPPLPRNATPDQLRDWIAKALFPRVTKEAALNWSQVNAAEGSVDDLQPGSLGEHKAATEAHGANGAILGKDDVPTTTVRGPVLSVSAIADLTDTATSPSGFYVQAEATAVADQAQNNTDKINAILAALRTAGILET